jgi:hypothetical protein
LQVWSRRPRRARKPRKTLIPGDASNLPCVALDPFGLRSLTSLGMRVDALPHRVASPETHH